MTVESASYIDELDPSTTSNSTDPTEGGAQIAMFKTAVKQSFPNVSGAVTTSDVELNYLDLTTLGTAQASKALTVSATNTIDGTILTWSNLGSVTTCDLNGGAIDGTTIGASSASTGAFTTLTASGNVTFTGGTINGIAIGGTTPAAGAFTTLTASSTVTFTSGTLNGVAIGGTTPAAGAFTTLSATGAVTCGSTLDVTGAATFTTAKANSQLGYRTGAGGTVTQATSRTTGVTINKACGSITLVSAAGSTTFQSFTVTNSVVEATDVIVIQQKSGADRYRIHVTNIQAGSFVVTFATVTGTTTEQPTFNFAVIKGVTS